MIYLLLLLLASCATTKTTDTGAAKVVTVEQIKSIVQASTSTAQVDVRTPTVEVVTDTVIDYPPLPESVPDDPTPSSTPVQTPSRRPTRVTIHRVERPMEPAQVIHVTASTTTLDAGTRQTQVVVSSTSHGETRKEIKVGTQWWMWPLVATILAAVIFGVYFALKRYLP